jgi:hypothetical protein
MYNFIFITDYNPWVINNNLIELQIHKSTNSTMQDSSYTTQHQMRRGINPQKIPICQQVHNLSIVKQTYVLHPAYAFGFSLYEKLRSFVAFSNIYFYL